MALATDRPPNMSRSSVSWLAGGWLALTVALQFLLETGQAAAALFSRPLAGRVVASLGGSPDPAAADLSRVPFLSCGLLAAVVLAAACAVARLRGRNPTAIGKIATFPGLWCLASYVCLLAGWVAGYGLLLGVADLVFALTVAGWLTVLMTPDESAADWSPRRGWTVIGVAAVAYLIVFTAMNWGLYWNLKTPHGDTVMYEEHLWNLLHGKGFRSYLDQGLFLGEHVQVAHLLLLPVYVLYPSHLTMELCESAALASTAVPTFLLARHATGSVRSATLLGVAVLFAAPLHYLDIEIDRKSFRPISLGVPALLWGLYFLETRRWKPFAAAAVVALLSKEDYALVLGPLGVWLAVTQWKTPRLRNIGGAIAVASGLYLLLAVKVVIPYFRGGETVHYARYFPQFGETPGQILMGMLTNPQVVIASVVTAPAVMYVLRVLSPLGFTPIRSWTAAGRAAVALPELGLLLLNELSFDPPAPVHHFHAPLLPILFWATAYAPAATSDRRDRMAAWTLSAAVCVSAVMSFTPASIAFWDSARPMYYASRYLPDGRAAAFDSVIEHIPVDSRVASTDYVHPRFTHHERSYDYSGYVRRVAGDTTAVPAETDYIVLDVHGPYSEITGLESVRELREEPDKWDVLNLDPTGHFIVLQRREPD